MTADDYDRLTELLAMHDRAEAEEKELVGLRKRLKSLKRPARIDVSDEMK